MRHVGHDSGSVCLGESIPGFLLRLEEPDVRVPDLLDPSGGTEILLKPKSNSEMENGDSGNAGLSSETLVLEVRLLEGILPSRDVELKNAVSKGIDWKSWTAEK